MKIMKLVFNVIMIIMVILGIEKECMMKIILIKILGLKKEKEFIILNKKSKLTFFVFCLCWKKSEFLSD